MKQKSTASVSIALMTLCLTFTGAKSQAQSMQADKGPVSVTASLVGSSTICVGEPILLKYVVKNTSELPVSVSTRQDRYGNEDKYDTLGVESFTTVGGSLLIPSASLLAPHYTSNTLKLRDGLDLEKDSSLAWEALASNRITFPHPGDYVLRVHVEQPYVVGSREQGSRYILSGDYVFPLKVVASNPVYLHSIAEKLRERILTTTDITARATLIQTLFSMPAFAASSSWQALVEEPKLDGSALSEITAALASLNSLRAADLLAEVVWSPVQPTTSLDEAMAGERLDEMHDASDPAVKKHIDDLTAQHQVPGAKKFSLQ